MVVPLGAVLVACALTVTGIALVMDLMLLTPIVVVVHTCCCEAMSGG